jgi:thiamine biosynthesis lipoprotein
LFTSGDYERFFEFEGKHYHHILDPRTGYPARGTRSVTVLTEDAALADAASTALFIAGPELWPEIAQQMDIQHVMLIADDNKIYLTQAMAERIELFTDIEPVVVK